ncbi:MAG: hypothetical protein S4CHLAM6_03660 [Chlamydiae bacterium]|nr:hypothetical protein [Chlamydiota bacterium]
MNRTSSFFRILCALSTFCLGSFISANSSIFLQSRHHRYKLNKPLPKEQDPEFIKQVNTDISMQKVTCEGRVAFFLPLGKDFQKTYGYSNLSYQLEALFLLPKNLNWWSNFSFLHTDGHSSPLKNPARLDIYSLSFGASYVFYVFNTIYAYIGLGGLYSWTNEQIRTIDFRPYVRRNGGGFISKLKISREIENQFFLSFFSNYQLLNFKKKSHFKAMRVNLSGFYVGIGAGLIF